MNDLEAEFAFFAAHVRTDTGDAPIRDAAAAARVRSLPKHRARRPRWKPDVTSGLQPVHAQHAHDRDSLVG